ncbi:MAG: tRNA (guanosine(46)-N7)-methyltransferase TrmB [Bacteroidia bacterium]|nr:tRNA (guanosine(46)-N7)-methyltransferase TrmB [Bacteroidia bacterium]
MAKKKLQRFAELNTFSNTFQFPKDIKGTWHTEVFKNNNPIVLELGCGKGEYTIGQARRFPEKNFIGCDIKGNRIWRGAKTALDEGLNNAAFLRTQIEQIAEYFAPGEVSEIWITFPDPQPNKPKTKRRLTSAQFTERYRQFLHPQGTINLKTDSRLLYEFTLEKIAEKKLTLLAHTDDLYHSPLLNEVLEIQTYYEGLFRAKGMPIHYVQYRF